MVSREPRWVEVKCKGEITGAEFFGRFSVKPYLTHKERADAIRLGELLSRGIEDKNQRLFHLTLAFLAFHVAETDAAWWKLDDKDDACKGLGLCDEEPVWAISAEVRKLQKPEEKVTEKPAEETKA